MALVLPALATLTLLVGILLALGALLRLGFLANFISEPVLIGFKAGIGLVIIVDQLPKLFGVHYPKGTFGQNLLSLVQSLPGTSLATLAVGLLTIGLLAGMERFTPRLPAPLVAVGAGIAAMALLGLGAAGVETVGQIPRGLPGLQWPDLSLAAALWPAALGIAVMSFTETAAVGRAFVAPGEPTPQAQPGTARDRHRHRGRRRARRHAGGRRHVPDGGEPAVRRAQPPGGRGDRRRDAADHAVPGALHQPDAPGDAGGGGHRVLGRADQARRVPLGARGPAHGVHLGAGGHGGRDHAGHAQGHPGRDRRLDGRAGPAGVEPAGLRAGPQAGHQRLPAPVAGAPAGRRDLSRAC